MILQTFRASSRRGFTLAEVLVVTGLMSILISLGVGIFLANNKFYQNQTGKVLNVNVTREAADRINEYTRLGITFATSHIYNLVTYTTGPETLILQIPSVESDGDIISGVFDYVIITKDLGAANRLLLIVDSHPSSSRLARFYEITSALTSLSFTYDNADLSLARKVAYQIDVLQAGRYPASEQINGSASLRNKN